MAEQDDLISRLQAQVDYAAVSDHVRVFRQDSAFQEGFQGGDLEEFDGEDTKTLVDDSDDENASVWPEDLRDSRAASWGYHDQWWADGNRREADVPQELDNGSVNLDQAESVAGEHVLLTSSDIPRISSMFGHLEYDLLGIGRQFDGVALRGVGDGVQPDDRVVPQPRQRTGDRMQSNNGTIPQSASHDTEHLEKSKGANGMIDTHIEAFNNYCMMVGMEVSEDPEAISPLDLLLASKQSKTTDCDLQTDIIEAMKNCSISDDEDGDYCADTEGQSPPTSGEGTHSRGMQLPSNGSVLSPFSNSSAADPTGNGEESSDNPQLSITERERSKPASACRRLLCWHAANGIRCKEQVIRSPETRRLLSDHSFCNRVNTHKLPPACTGCGIIYLEKQAAEDHKVLSMNGLACRGSENTAIVERNAALERIGISESKYQKIKEARANFRKSRHAPSLWLPNGCDPEHFQEWIDRNVPTYIAESSTVYAEAAQELGEWYIVFVTLFPGENIPSDPFTEPADEQHCRLLELIEGGLINSANNGVLPRFDQQQLAIFRNVVKVALDTLQSELLQQQCTRKKARSRPKKRKRSVNEANITKDSSSDSRLSLTPFPSSTTSGSPQYPDAKKWRQATPYQTWSPPVNPETVQPTALNNQIFEPHPTEPTNFQSLPGLIEPTVSNDFGVDFGPLNYLVDPTAGLSAIDPDLFQWGPFS